jgi:hypothetical protein
MLILRFFTTSIAWDLLAVRSRGINQTSLLISALVARSPLLLAAINLTLLRSPSSALNNK